MLHSLMMHIVHTYDIVGDICVEVILVCDDALGVQVVTIDLSDDGLVEGRMMIVLADYDLQV